MIHELREDIRYNDETNELLVERVFKYPWGASQIVDVPRVFAFKVYPNNDFTEFYDSDKTHTFKFDEIDKIVDDALGQYAKMINESLDRLLSCSNN